MYKIATEQEIYGISKYLDNNYSSRKLCTAARARDLNCIVDTSISTNTRLIGLNHVQCSLWYEYFYISSGSSNQNLVITMHPTMTVTDWNTTLNNINIGNSDSGRDASITINLNITTSSGTVTKSFTVSGSFVGKPHLYNASISWATLTNGITGIITLVSIASIQSVAWKTASITSEKGITYAGILCSSLKFNLSTGNSSFQHNYILNASSIPAFGENFSRVYVIADPNDHPSGIAVPTVSTGSWVNSRKTLGIIGSLFGDYCLTSASEPKKMVTNNTYHIYSAVVNSTELGSSGIIGSISSSGPWTKCGEFTYRSGASSDITVNISFV